MVELCDEGAVVASQTGRAGRLDRSNDRKVNRLGRAGYKGMALGIHRDASLLFIRPAPQVSRVEDRAERPHLGHKIVRAMQGSLIGVNRRKIGRVGIARYVAV